jgi:late competence protein required for DNA uptake (superfamily II DNA/RNA helicase)
MTFHNYDIAVAYLKQQPLIDFNNSFDLAKLASNLLAEKGSEKHGRELVIRMKDAIRTHRVAEQTLHMWNEMLVAAGLFPYVDMEELHLGSRLQQEFHRSDNLEGVYLHEQQAKISNHLLNGESVILSAPTSYGKSLLIEEVVASGIYNNIVIIQPTLALLDETRKKLRKYNNRYKLIVSTSQNPAENKGNIFLFTGERVVEFDRFPAVDFFVIDEFYKLSLERDDDRAIILNQALYKLRKLTSKFYMLGPSIQGVPENVLASLGAVWEQTDFATVAVNEKTLLGRNDKPIPKNKRKEELFALLCQTTEPTLIYVASPASCTQLATEFIAYAAIHHPKDEPVPPEISIICEWITENIHKNWALVDALKNGIAFHHGALPRHLGSSIVDAFNAGHIKYLFCTATLIEGVNTSAKNVILFDKKKGNKPIDFFDYKNIAGRSGRMRQHYIGNVIKFEKEPPQLDFEVDIPIYSQANAPVEILLGIDKMDVLPEQRHRLDKYENLPADLLILLKQHSTVNIDGQLELVEKLQSDPYGYHRLLSWTSAFPTYEQLAAVVTLAWDYLAKDEDHRMRVSKIGTLSARWLAGFAFSYHRLRSLGAIIRDAVASDFWKNKIEDSGTRINEATFAVLQISRSYFDYKLPKWLTVINGLQSYVFTREGLQPGNYLPFASQLENGFLDPALAALREYDIPLTALRKLTRILAFDNPESNLSILRQITHNRLREAGLLEYEIAKIRQAF